jgi:hypothetical protein
VHEGPPRPTAGRDDDGCGQFIATMQRSIIGEVSRIESQAQWGHVLAWFTWIASLLGVCSAFAAQKNRGNKTFLSGRASLHSVWAALRLCEMLAWISRLSNSHGVVAMEGFGIDQTRDRFQAGPVRTVRGHRWASSFPGLRGRAW